MNTFVHENVKKFLELLGQADVVEVDDGPMLTSWDDCEPSGKDDNQILHFSWADEDGTYGVVLTEKGIAEGHWEGTSFFCEDHEGESTKISLYVTQPLFSI